MISAKHDKLYKVEKQLFPDEIYLKTRNIEALRIIKSFINPKDCLKSVQA
jgi:hypothetical protein